MSAGSDRLEFTLTKSNLDEGGRVRGQEAYLNMNATQAGAIGPKALRVLTPDGVAMECRASGATAWANVKPGQAPVPKNLRSVPADVLGRWLASKGAKAGDKVVAYPLEPGLWLFRHVRVEESVKPKEAVDWEAVFGGVPTGTPGGGRTDIRREEDYYRGRGTRGAR